MVTSGPPRAQQQPQPPGRLSPVPGFQNLRRNSQRPISDVPDIIYSSRTARRTAGRAAAGRGPRARRRARRLPQQRLQAVELEGRALVQQRAQRLPQLGRLLRQQPARDPGVRGRQHLVARVRRQRDALRGAAARLSPFCSFISHIHPSRVPLRTPTALSSQLGSLERGWGTCSSRRSHRRPADPAAPCAEGGGVLHIARV